MDGTVLILDDDAGVLELTALYLKARGFSTLTCDSAQSAMEKFRDAGGAIGILIADVTLPGSSSGVEVAVKLWNLAPKLKILFVSGYSFEDLSGPDSALYHLLSPSCVRFLRKPYSAQDLVARLLELTADSPVVAPPRVVYEALERQTGFDMVYDAVIARTLKGEIRYWNRGAQILYGWTDNQAIGKSITDLLQTEFPEPIEDILNHLRNTGRWEGELCQRTCTGDIVTVSSRWGLRYPALAYSDAGEIEILEINHDINYHAKASAAGASSL
jgi:PAS domain S-box-containing protein